MELTGKTLIGAMLLATVTLSSTAQPPSPDAAAVAATVRAFHQALAAGDSAGALRHLAADAVILESGSRESRDEYAAHHLPADIEFARAVPMQQGPLQVTVSADAAWTIATNVMQGTFQNRPIDLAAVELMVLSRTTGGWEIRAIHWSSQPR